MSKKKIITGSLSSEREKISRERFFELFKNTPIPPNEILQNLGLYINRQLLSKILFMHELYIKIINIHGIIIEFGTRWGQNLALFESFRGIYEPYNYSRKIVGFDTFEGFPSIHEKDGHRKVSKVGAYSVTENYEEHLESILDYHESESPLSHIKKYEILKGDVLVTFEDYLNKNPETIISLAYFDLDIYEPTKKCLELIKPYLTKGSVIGFDELAFKDFPGETIALREVLGLDKYKIQRTPLNPFPSYIIIE
ncbi:MAG: crotonobetainyl-CoA--carnitine CoA-transferase [Patescibacteria group bacterium]|nr:crotonobetainyl-CoA--carnitine CoA-transferase [Patescibacteria group bacterium]